VAPHADHLEDVVRKTLALQPDLPPVEVINKGQDNETIQLLLDKRYNTDIARLAPVDFIFVRYGINDRSYLADFRAIFPRTYHELIAKLRRDHPQASITLETIIPYRDEESTREVNLLIRDIAAEEGLPVLDTYACYSAELKKGPNTLTYRQVSLESVPLPYRASLPAGSIINGNTVCILDDTIDARLSDVPGWFADRHPNLAGYAVIGSELANYLAPQIRSMQTRQRSPATASTGLKANNGQ
jgi:lysophospholipase L1-like esterase